MKKHEALVQGPYRHHLPLFRSCLFELDLYFPINFGGFGHTVYNIRGISPEVLSVEIGQITGHNLYIESLKRKKKEKYKNVQRCRGPSSLPILQCKGTRLTPYIHGVSIKEVTP